MTEDSKQNIADHIGAAIKAVEKVNEQLSKALLEAGGAKEDGSGEHHHHHGHHHHHH